MTVPRQRSMHGFSLLEVLASLALLALLLGGVYAGVSAASRSVRSGESSIERMDQVRSAQQFLCRELAQSLTMPLDHNDQGDNIYFVGRAREMRYVAPLPGYLGSLGPQLQVLRLVDDGHGASRLEASFALLPPDGGAPRPLGPPEVLVDGIRDGGFAYRGRDIGGKPGGWGADWADGRLLPALVRIELKLDGAADWPRLDVPLRVDPSANQGPVDLLRGLRGNARRATGF